MVCQPSIAGARGLLSVPESLIDSSPAFVSCNALDRVLLPSGIWQEIELSEPLGWCAFSAGYSYASDESANGAVRWYKIPKPYIVSIGKIRHIGGQYWHDEW